MSGTDADVVAAAFGTETVLAINSILDTLPQGDRIETPDINDITGLFDSIEDETAIEPTPWPRPQLTSYHNFKRAKHSRKEKEIWKLWLKICIETQDINNLSGYFDSSENETVAEQDTMTKAAVNFISQF